MFWILSSVKGEGLPIAVSKLFSSGELGRELDRMPSENSATLGADRVSYLIWGRVKKVNASITRAATKWGLSLIVSSKNSA